MMVRGQTEGQNKSKPERVKPGTSEPNPDSHPFQCSTCDARFKYKSHLLSHSPVHSGSKPFKCPQCPSSFARKPTLTRHLLVHSQVKIKSHKCSECSLSFARSETLKKHFTRTHSSNKEFSCPDCSQKFTYALLWEHLKNQHNKAPNFCSECPRKFTKQWEANRHMEIVHKILTPYSCSISSCNQSFRLKKELLAHEATHNEKDEKNNNYNKIESSSSSSSKSKTKTSTKTTTIKRKSVTSNFESDTEEIESENETSINEEKNLTVKDKVVDADDENMVTKNVPTKNNKNNNIDSEKANEEKECEFLSSKPYWCFCGKCFHTKELFTHHQDNEESGKHFLQLHECPLCPKNETFETFEEFEDHYSSFHQLLIHECPLCGDEYGTIQELEDHLDQVDPSLFLK